MTRGSGGVYDVELDGDPSETGYYALFSGGDDSLASTHLVMERRDTPADRVVYLDTRSGLDANLEYVREVCDDYGWPLVVATAPIDLEQFATGDGPGDRDAWGFPGPGAHSWAFRYFKERQIQHLNQCHDDPAHFYTGVRSAESDRRLENVNDTGRDDTGRWVYVNPIHDWPDRAVDAYRERHDLPRNPVAEAIGRSGDCYCGAFAARTEELVELQAHYPDHAEWLLDVEQRVQAALGADRDEAYWGFGNLGDKELRAMVAANDPDQMALCSTCDVPSIDGLDAVSVRPDD